MAGTCPAITLGQASMHRDHRHHTQVFVIVRKKYRSSTMPGLYPSTLEREATALAGWNIRMYGPSSVTVFCSSSYIASRLAGSISFTAAVVLAFTAGSK